MRTHLPLLLSALTLVLFAATRLASQERARAATPAGVTPATVQVGVDSGDFRGSDHRALQAAVDYAAGLGGGLVRIGAGRYTMRNALTLRDGVSIAGEPGRTVLAACDGARTPLAADGDCNERQITVEDPSIFQVGDGVVVRDGQFGHGFTVTTATITSRVDERSFRISAPLYLDYMVSEKATASLAFPVVGGWRVKGITLEGLTIEGNRGRAEPIDGCRGGGIYLFECEDVTIRNCVVRAYNGDGISFQVSERVTIEDSLCERNAGLGLHPGSGSQRPVLRRNRSFDNDRDGLFVCWRVKHGLFEENEVRGNRGAGLSIGHKDTDNLFRRNAFVENAGPGVLFREETEAMGAHRNVFEENRILDNGAKDGAPPVLIRGVHHNLVFRRNVIGRSEAAAGGASGPGIVKAEASRELKMEDNRFVNVGGEVAAARGQ
jgi:hypothetical protein